MPGKNKENGSKSIAYHHREGALWLTTDICNEYYKRARQIMITDDNGARRALRIELQNKCDITELQAINVLNGMHIGEYVHYYELMRGEKTLGKSMTCADFEVLERIAEMENAEIAAKLNDILEEED